jgi:hypothetical protein
MKERGAKIERDENRDVFVCGLGGERDERETKRETKERERKRGEGERKGREERKAEGKSSWLCEGFVNVHPPAGARYRLCQN